MITRATPDDIPLVVALGRENYAAVNGEADTYDHRAASDFLREVVFERGAVFLSRAGMIGGVLSPRWHAPTVVEAVEMMWFAKDGAGGLLLRAWCRFAKRCKAQPVITSRQMPEGLAKRLGLRASEIMWRG